jgi:predicted enzyme related to lactoylglutathione lyase
MMAADLGSLGTFHPFAWERGGDIVGSMSDIATRSAIHPNWLFHFKVAALEPAIAAVSSANGLVVDTVMLPTGQRIAICDDPQGAAFAICEASPIMSDLPVRGTSGPNARGRR